MEVDVLAGIASGPARMACGCNAMGARRDRGRLRGRGSAGGWNRAGRGSRVARTGRAAVWEPRTVGSGGRLFL